MKPQDTFLVFKQANISFLFKAWRMRYCLQRGEHWSFFQHLPWRKEAQKVFLLKKNCLFYFLLWFYDFSLCLLVMHIFLVIAFQNYITFSVFLTISYTHIIYCDYIQLPLLLSVIFLPLLIPSSHLVPIRENYPIFPNTC